MAKRPKTPAFHDDQTLASQDDQTPASHERVRWVYEARSRAELETCYDRWAADYDADLTQDFGYVAPRLAVAKIARFLDDDPLVLDAGVGTGLVGEALRAAGISRITGIDMSEGMLAAARKKNLYDELRRMVMGEPLDFPDRHFDGTLCIGTLTQGHAPASSLCDLVRITKPGGPIVFTLMTEIYQTQGFKEIQDDLAAKGLWRLVEADRALHIMPKGEPDLEHDIWVYQVT